MLILRARSVKKLVIPSAKATEKDLSTCGLLVEEANPDPKVRTQKFIRL